jgi:hypothetical protein
MKHMETREIEKIMKKPEQELLAEWFDVEMRLELGSSAEDVVSKPGELRKLFKKWSGENLRDVICSDWDYCQKRKQFGKTVELVSQLGEFIYNSMKLPIPIPFSLAALVVMHGFDQFCDCGEG